MIANADIETEIGSGLGSRKCPPQISKVIKIAVLIKFDDQIPRSSTNKAHKYKGMNKRIS
ncbi:hypothetical protein GCM10007978_14880 [Shewanella hanedai]|nr:hypothetical protein GCM10007978_14880 [Shewanella hanedai]